MLIRKVKLEDLSKIDRISRVSKLKPLGLFKA